MSARVSVRALRTDTNARGGNPNHWSHDEEAIVTIAVKSATTATEMDRLAVEADRIRQVSHPGVVTFVDYQTGSDWAELHTLYVGPALGRRPGGIPQVAGLVAALATTVSELHDMGVVHGRIDPSHVLVRPDGRPVLCGLSAHSQDAEPSDDVAALGELLRTLIGDADKHARPGRWRRLLEPAAPRRLLTLAAERATDPTAERRPTARALARSILDAVPEAALAESPERQPTPPSPARGSLDAADEPSPTLFDTAFVDLHDTGEHEIFGDRPWQETAAASASPTRSRRPRPQPSRRQHRPALVAVGGACLVLLGSVGAWALLHEPDRPRVGEAPAASDNVATTARATEPSACPEPDPEDGPPDAVATHEVDVTGDGCLEVVAITANGVVAVGRERWAVGEPGDSVTFGDWDCSGVATPALYRQATGDVFVFSEWADGGQPERVEPVERVSGGVSFSDSAAVADIPAAGGCDVPVVELASGGYHPVEVTTVDQ